MSADVVIAGAGPAGLSAAAACCRLGMRVRLVDPAPETPWAPSYAGWVDELDVPWAATWPSVEVRLGEGEVVTIPRAYGRVDGEALRARLRDEAASAEVVAGRIERVERDQLVDDGGRAHRGRAVDARGAAPGATLFQTAYGVTAIADGGPEAAQWMDFSFPFGDGSEAPSFLYALPMPDGSTFLEETSLVRGPELPIELLRERLERRLAARGVRLGPVRSVERCRIALDAPLPSPADPVRFGAAGSMVHPATGFSLARALRSAGPLARALAAGADAWPALWPEDSLRRASLHRYGAAAIATFDAADTRAFFRAFFAQDPAFVAGWLGDTLPAPAVARGMARLFTSLPRRLALRLAVRGPPRELVRAALAPTTDRSLEDR